MALVVDGRLGNQGVPGAGTELVPLTGYPGTTRYAAMAGQVPSAEQVLLSTLATPELRDTDVYVYRVSDGRLIGSRWGLTSMEVSSAWVDSNRNGQVDANERLAAGCEGHACVQAVALMRGPASRFLGFARSQYNAATTVPPLMGSDGTVKQAGRFGVEVDYTDNVRDGLSNYVREGDQVKIILVNRAVGYMGSALATVQRSANGTTTFVSESGATPMVELRPPNLQVIARRNYEVAQGARRGLDVSYVVGFEGSALDSDAQVTIETRWYDWDGKPLPEDLPGFTGRLAKVVLASEGDPEALSRGTNAPHRCNHENNHRRRAKIPIAINSARAARLGPTTVSRSAAAPQRSPRRRASPNRFYLCKLKWDKGTQRSRLCGLLPARFVVARQAVASSTTAGWCSATTAPSAPSRPSHSAEKLGCSAAATTTPRVPPPRARCGWRPRRGSR